MPTHRRYHPRVSVNAISSMQQSLADDITMWRALGIDHVGLILHKVEAVGFADAETMLRDAGLTVSTIAGPVPVPLREGRESAARRAERRLIGRALEFAASVGAKSLYLCTGAADGLIWSEAAERFCVAVAPSAERATDLGVRLAVEPTNPLRADVSFVFTFADAVDLARAAGVGVVADVQSCWYERDIAERLRKHVENIALVQVSDYVVGSGSTPDRAVPGDGVIPIDRLLTAVLDAGYDGPVDIEVLGPRIEALGYVDAVARSAAYVSGLLDRLAPRTQSDLDRSAHRT